MSHIRVIAWKEIRTYFASPMAYVAAAAFMAITGFFFVASVSDAFSEATVRGFLAGAVFIFIFMSPALTMRLIAEEQKLGTLELLLTSPVREVEVALGKFIAAFTMVLIMAALSLYFALAALGLLATLDLNFALVALDLYFVLELGTALALGLLAALVPAALADLALCADLALGMRLDLPLFRIGVGALVHAALAVLALCADLALGLWLDLPHRVDMGALVGMSAALAQGDQGALAPGAMVSLHEAKEVSG